MRLAISSLYRNLLAGLRLSLFLPVTRLEFRIDLVQLLLLFVLSALIDVAGDWSRTGPPREFSLLEYLMRNPNRTVTKTMILEHVFDYSFDPQTNVVDVLVHRLRSKVDKDRAMLHTIRGVGYALRPS